ncbi:MAG: tetratricopeptide repeat protein [Verrucomicrobiaceae bacterium]
MSEEEQAFANAERYYNFGNEVGDRFEKARYMDYAIGLYKSYLDQFPNGGNAPAVYFHMGKAQQSLGRIDEASRIYRQLIDRYRRGNWVGLAARQIAWLAYTTEDWAGAAAYFELAAKEVTRRETKFSSLTKRVECLIKLDRDLDVIDALKGILNSPGHPHAQWARFMLGYQYYQAEKFQLTIETLKPLLSESVGNNYRSQAMFYTGLASTELGLDDSGQSYLQQVLELPSNSPGLTNEQKRQIAHNKTLAQTALMNLAAANGDHDEVVRLYRLGDFGATGRTEARRSMTAGKAFYALKRYQDARSSFRRVDRSTPNTPTAFDAAFRCLLCDFQMGQPSLDERVEAFEELYRGMFPGHQNIQMARFLKAESLYDLGDFEAAATAFSEVQSNLIPRQHRSELFYKAGWALAEMGDNNGATRSFTSFLEAFPDDDRRQEALGKRAEAYFRLGDRTSALKDYEDLLNETSAPRLISFALQGSARALRAEKSYPLMVERYRRLLAEFTDLPADTVANANYWIGWGYFKLEKLEQAKPYLEKSRDLVPEFYNEPAGNLLVMLTFSQADAEAMNSVLTSLLEDFPGKSIPSHMLTWLGLQLYHTGDFENSVRYLGRAANPERPDAVDISVWRTLAKGQNELNLHQQALQSAQIVLKMEQDPRWKADTLLDIAHARFGLNQIEEALRATQDGLAIKAPGTHTAGLHLILGKIAFTRENYQDALSEFDATRRIAVDDPVVTPEALYWSSLAAEKLGDLTLSRQLNAELAASFPNWNPPVKEEQSPQTEEIGE